MAQLPLPKTSTEYEAEIVRQNAHFEEVLAIWKKRALAAENERDQLQEAVLDAICAVVGHQPDQNCNRLSRYVPCLRCGTDVEA